MTIGLGLAGTAQGQTGQDVGRSAIRPAISAGPRPTATPTKECFYTFPSCTSSDPSVKFSIVSVGDTSGCTSQDTVVWGDKSSTTKTYAGGPNGSTLVSFNHTYTDGPRRYPITINGKTVSGDCGTLTGAALSFTLAKPSVSLCAAGTQLSGPAWTSRFPNSKSLDKLNQPFRSDVTRFIAAMSRAGVKEKTIQTFRSPERAYLLHYSWLVAKRKLAPQKVPAFAPASGQAAVRICWVHAKSGAADVAASVAAAAQMVKAFKIDPKLKVAPSLTTLHSQGLAIDMTTTWTAKKITIAAASGKDVTIGTTPRSGLNRLLIAVGASYHVIHFKNAAKDPNHWSVNGR